MEYAFRIFFELFQKFQCYGHVISLIQFQKVDSHSLLMSVLGVLIIFNAFAVTIYLFGLLLHSVCDFLMRFTSFQCRALLGWVTKL